MSQKPDAARITKLDTEMFHHVMSPGNQFILGSKVKVTKRKKTVPVWIFLHSC